jgi:hypothetical protein
VCEVARATGARGEREHSHGTERTQAHLVEIASRCDVTADTDSRRTRYGTHILKINIFVPS